MEAMTQTQSRLVENLNAMVQKMATVEANLQHYKSHTEELREVNQAQNEQLKALKDITSGSTSKRALTAALGNPVGPFQQNTPLKYPKIFSNIGSSYNPATGIFTALVRGGLLLQIYDVQQQLRPAQLCGVTDDEQQRLVSTWDTAGDDSNDSASNAAVVQLEVGDNVFVQLYANRVLYDDLNYYNTFSGFLLVTM